MKTCIICKKKFEGFGHNPEPLANKGRCCDNCNNLVIKTRLLELTKNGN